MSCKAVAPLLREEQFMGDGAIRAASLAFRGCTGAVATFTPIGVPNIDRDEMVGPLQYPATTTGSYRRLAEYGLRTFGRELTATHG